MGVGGHALHRIDQLELCAFDARYRNDEVGATRMHRDSPGTRHQAAIVNDFRERDGLATIADSFI